MACRQLWMVPLISSSSSPDPDVLEKRKTEEMRRGGGGCLNISAIIASQPWHAVCQPPQGSLHSSQENMYTKSSTEKYTGPTYRNTQDLHRDIHRTCTEKYTGPAQRNTQDWQTECKRSVSSLHSCTWPHTLSHLSFPRHCHHRAAHHPWHDRHQKPTLG